MVLILGKSTNIHQSENTEMSSRNDFHKKLTIFQLNKDYSYLMLHAFIWITSEKEETYFKSPIIYIRILSQLRFSLQMLVQSADI